MGDGDEGGAVAAEEAVGACTVGGAGEAGGEGDLACSVHVSDAEAGTEEAAAGAGGGKILAGEDDGGVSVAAEEAGLNSAGNTGEEAGEGELSCVVKGVIVLEGKGAAAGAGGELAISGDGGEGGAVATEVSDAAAVGGAGDRGDECDLAGTVHDGVDIETGLLAEGDVEGAAAEAGGGLVVSGDGGDGGAVGAEDTGGGVIGGVGEVE